MKTAKEIRRIARQGARRMQHDVDTARLEQSIEDMIRANQEQRKKLNDF